MSVWPTRVFMFVAATDNVLHRDIVLTQGIVERCFLVGRRFAFANNQGTRYLVRAGGECFGIGAGDNNRSCGYYTFILDRLGAADVDNFSRSRKNHVST